MKLKTRIFFRYNYLLFSALFLFNSPAYTSFEDLIHSARAAAMGEAFVGLANTSQAILINPAGLADFKSLEFASFYYRPYNLKELTSATMTFTLPLRYFVPGLAIQQYGHSNYLENSINVALSKNYRRLFSYGITCRLMHLKIKNYGADFAFGMDLGLLIHPNEKTAFGFVIKNINRPKIGQINEPVPPILVSGVCIRPFPNLYLTGDLYKHIDFPVDLRSGLELKLSNFLLLRGGVASEPARFSLGFGLHLYTISIDYTFVSHPTLNLTHLISISFIQKTKN